MSIDGAFARGLGQAPSLAKVVSVQNASVQVSAPAFGRSTARLAVPGYAARAGDAVLVATADDGSRYVIGVVRALRESTAERAEVRASDGVRARLERDEEGREVLALRDAEDRLLIAHRPALGRTEIFAEGDLALRAGGDLELDAAGTVRVAAGANLDLTGRDVRIASSDPSGDERSALTMREGRTELSTDRLGASVDRADLTVRELNVVTRTMRTVAGRVKREFEVLETRAERIVERTKESFRETEGLHQTKAGRLRMVAETAFTVLSDKALLKAKDDVKIKGEKIYLA